MASTAKSFDEVFEQELHDIRMRREVAGLLRKRDPNRPETHDESEPTDEEIESQIRDELAGLALSGGGVRSAAFNLGLLQALYQSGRMKDVDYLSTVSGGGYSGALFSAAVANDTDGVNWERDSRYNRLDIEARPDGAQPDRVYELAMHGRAMAQPIQWLSRHLWGWLLTLLFVFSGVVTIASLLAWTMKSVWSRDSLLRLQTLGFNSDLHIVFYPAFLAVLIWLLCQFTAISMRALKVRIPPITRYSYILLVATLVLGAISLMAIGDFGMGDYLATNAVPASWEDTVTWLLHTGGTAIMGLLTVSLLPLLAPHKLVESGRNRQNVWQKLAFNIAGYAMVFGVPLAAFYHLSMENVSDYNTTRVDSDVMGRNHLHQLDDFIARIDADQLADGDQQADGDKQSEAAKILRESVARQIYLSIEESGKRNVYLNQREQIIKDQKQLTFPTRLLQYLAHLVGLHDGYEQRLKGRWTTVNARTDIAKRISLDVLSNPLLLRPTATEKPETVLVTLGLDDRAENVSVPCLAALRELTVAHKMFRHDYDPAFEVVGKQVYPFGQRVPTDSAELRSELLNRVLNYEINQPSTDEDLQPPGQIFCAIQALLHSPFYELAEKLGISMKLLAKDPDQSLEFERLCANEKAHFDALLKTIRVNNWTILHHIYPEYIKPRDTVFAWIVNAADQSYRLQIAGYSLATFLIIGLLANLNYMCLHGVYRDGLASVWLPTGPLLLKELDTCRHGGAFHLINATLNRRGKQIDPDPEGLSRFVLSNRFCGSKRFGYRDTAEYEHGELGLADAVAISGAAVSTSYVGDVLFRTLLFLTNLRLGQWVRNPKHFHEEHYWPSPLRTMIGQLWHPTDRAYVDLTDGGHLDNTGLASLLERRCRVMILGDGSQDSEYTFEDLHAVLQSARAKYGVQIVETTNDAAATGLTEAERAIDALNNIAPDEERNYESQQHFAVFRIIYPKRHHDDNEDGAERDGLAPWEPKHRSAVLIVVKPSLTGDEPADLLALRRRNAGFPNDATINQFLEPDQFEAYVMLGRHIGEQLDHFLCEGGLNAYGAPGNWANRTACTDEATDHSQEANHSEEVTPKAAQSPVETDDPALHSVVAQLLDDTLFDKTGIALATSLICQWSDKATPLKPQMDVFDKVVRPVSAWARHFEDASPSLRRSFCNPLIETLETQQWIYSADKEIRQEFSNILETLGAKVGRAKATIAKLKSKTEKAEGQSSESP